MDAYTKNIETKQVCTQNQRMTHTFLICRYTHHQYHHN